FLRADRMIHRVRISDIEYAESMENYVKVVTSSDKFVTRSSMKDFLKPVAAKGIEQVHKSYAVNIGRIKKIDGNQIITEGDYAVPLSKTFRDRVLSLLTDL
ncbi:MAG: LytTR family transcriptional regulator, partial [Muribaculaceae bacterium]|nr:LytTR family transcriptional regulator [Muribaculaceae bacterium]